MSRLLKRLYYDTKSPGSLGGVQSLYRAAKREDPDISLESVRKFLKAQPTYTLHKPSRLRFKRQKTYVAGPGQQFQIDLVDLRDLAKYNDGYSHLLTCIDVFSKIAHVRAIKKKTETVDAFESILEKSGKPSVVQSDKGTEFVNKKFQQMLKDRNIHFFTSEGDTKCAVVERFHRTLKSRMWRFFTDKETYRWIDVVQDLVKSYNNTYHTSIKTTPASVSTTNERKVWKSLYGKRTRPSPFKFKVNDTVRISISRYAFKRGYQQNWSEEYFTVVERNDTIPRTYILKDLHGETLKGRFYEQELQSIDPPSKFKVEKVLKKKDGKYYVKWKGWPSSYNSWVNSDDVSAI